MGNEDLARFCAVYLPGNAAVQVRLGGILDEGDLARAMVEAAASAGYRFTEADVLDALRSGRGPGATTELSDEQLAAVSGGLWRAGGDPIKYMEFKLKEVRISSVIA